METHAIEVDYRYSRDQLEALFALARTEDVEKGGRYDARSGAINIYTHPCNSPTMQEESTLMGSIYVFWAEENGSGDSRLRRGFPLRTCWWSWGRLRRRRWG